MASGPVPAKTRPLFIRKYSPPFRGRQTLEILQRPGSYEKLEALSKRMVEGILAAAKENGHDACGGYIRGMFGFFFNKGPVNTFADAAKSDGGVYVYVHDFVRACVRVCRGVPGKRS